MCASTITDVDGNKIPYSDIMPNVGIVQSNSCTRQSAWNAILCQDINHRIMVIESMDKDTEVRRVSPIALLSSNGYIDLINGGLISVSPNLFELKVRVASISDGSDYVGWLVRSELVILVESHVTILFNAEINIHLIL